MTNTILNTIITIIVSSILGYCINAIKGYKKKLEIKENNEKKQNEALQVLLKSQQQTYSLYIMNLKRYLIMHIKTF